MVVEKYLVSMLILVLSFVSLGQNIYEYNKGVRFEKYQGNEASIKNYLDNNDLDPIEGIWSLSISGYIDVYPFKFENAIKLGIIKDTVNDRDYMEVLISVSDKVFAEETGWKPFYIISKIEKTAYPYLFIETPYKALNDVKGAPKSVNLLMEDYHLITSSSIFWSDGIKHDANITAVRMYPEGENLNLQEPIKENIWQGNGTGFFIDVNGYIATNYHVIENVSEIEIEFLRNGLKQVYPATVVMSDKQNDLAILKINSDDFKPFTEIPYFFKSNISDVGTNVFSLGFPMALSLMGEEIKFTDGKISSKTGLLGDITSYQISVPIQPGNSGGPLFDYDGNLVGVTSSTVNRELNITENVNYAIKTSYLKNLIDVLDTKIELPNNKTIINKTLTEKIKVLSDYVVLVKIK